MDLVTSLGGGGGGGGVDGGLQCGRDDGGGLRALLQVAVLPADRGVGGVAPGRAVAIWVPAVVPLQIPGQEVKDIGPLRWQQQQADPLALRLAPIMVNSKRIAFICHFHPKQLTLPHFHHAGRS